MSDPQGFSFDPDAEEREYEWERDPSRYATQAEWEWIQAHRAPADEPERRARAKLAESPACKVCGLPVVTGGFVHSTCTPTCQRCWRPATTCRCR